MSESTPAPTLTTPAPATPGAPTPAPNSPAPTPAPEGAPAPNPFHLPDWKSNETLAGYETQLSKFTDPNTGVLDAEKLGKAYGELERYKGGPAPEPIAPEDFTKAIGQVQVPEGLAYPDEFRQEMTKVALESGVAPEAFSKMEKAMLDAQARQYAAYEQQRQAEGQQAFDALQQEVGLGKIDAYIDDAKRAAETLGFKLDMNERTPERVQEIKAFAHIAEKIGEAKFPNSGTPTGGTGGAGGLSAAEDIRTNPGNPWYEAYKTPSHPQHTDAQKEYDKLLFEGVNANPGKDFHHQGGRI